VKALTLWRPWPYAIFHLPADIAKPVENRTGPPPSSLVGERIAIHAGKTWDDSGKWLIQDLMCVHLDLDEWRLPDEQPEGIIGTVRLRGVKRGADHWTAQLVAGELLANAGSGVWYRGPYGWLLDDVRALPEPIPCKGQRGLWDVPEELVGRLAA